MVQENVVIAAGVPPIVRAMRRIVSLEECVRVDRMMHSPANIESILGAVEMATHGKVTVVKHAVEIFPNNAFTLLAVLSASSLDIHCWPECGMLDLMVYMCQGYEDGSDNGPYAAALCDHYIEYFGARKVEGPFLVPGGPRPSPDMP
jgi:S-adenosylmethionine/arginine decarboxylase-like enzyme